MGLPIDDDDDDDDDDAAPVGSVAMVRQERSAGLRVEPSGKRDVSGVCALCGCARSSITAGCRGCAARAAAQCAKERGAQRLLLPELVSRVVGGAAQAALLTRWGAPRPSLSHPYAR